jgi:hypothetical protein
MIEKTTTDSITVTPITLVLSLARDPDFSAVADRVHDAISVLPTLTGQLIRVIRPNNPPQVP